MATVILSLGSNIGDRAFYLEQARIALQELMSDFRASRVIETEPLYVMDQPAFLNQVVIGDTRIYPEALIVLTKALQRKIGRTNTFQNGPREIDIDMLYYDDLIMETAELVVPHPRIAERLFVLEPLCEMMPDWICPVTHKSIRTILDDLLQ